MMNRSNNNNTGRANTFRPDMFQSNIFNVRELISKIISHEGKVKLTESFLSENSKTVFDQLYRVFCDFLESSGEKLKLTLLGGIVFLPNFSKVFQTALIRNK